MIKVEKGQDPYSVIGQYIRDHISAIEDMIAVIEIDERTSNELFMVDMQEDGYFVWESDWYEGEENVALIDFFPVSDACNPKDHWIPCSEKLPENDCQCIVTAKVKHVDDYPDYEVDTADYTDGIFTTANSWWGIESIIAWMPLPERYQESEQDE